MAYIGTVDYDEGGRIRTLEGMGVVSYDNGARRNLSGIPLSAVKYDDGGRFRTLVGMGDVPVDMAPPDIPIVEPSSLPILYSPPSPVMPFIPSPAIDTQSASITGGLQPPTFSAGTIVSAPAPVTGVLDSIFSSIKSIFTPTGQAMAANGQLIAPSPSGVASSASWFTEQTLIAGLPNWGILGGGLLGLVLIGSSRSSRKRSRNPIRRNPMELVLMGANPKKDHLSKEKRERLSSDWDRGYKEGRQGKSSGIGSSVYRRGIARGYRKFKERK